MPRQPQLTKVDHSKWVIEEDEDGNLHICMSDHEVHESCKPRVFIKPADEWGERSYFDVWGRVVRALDAADPDWDSDSSKSPIQAACDWIANMVSENEQARDIKADIEGIIGMIGRGLGVEVEPHQSYTERLMDAVKSKPLSFMKMRVTNAARCLRWHKGGIEEWSVSDWGVAMAGEAGEVCDAIKKLRRIETGADNKSDIQTVEDAKEAIGIELADTVLYADLLAQRLNIDLDTYIIRKFNSVSEKYGFPERL